MGSLRGSSGWTTKTAKASPERENKRKSRFRTRRAPRRPPDRKPSDDLIRQSDHNTMPVRLPAMTHAKDALVPGTPRRRRAARWSPWSRSEKPSRHAEEGSRLEVNSFECPVVLQVIVSALCWLFERAVHSGETGMGRTQRTTKMQGEWKRFKNSEASINNHDVWQNVVEPTRHGVTLNKRE